MSSVLGQVGGFWEHLRHPLVLHREDLHINLRDQKIKLLMQSLFCGATSTLLAVVARSKPLTQASKAGFVLLAVGVTGASFFLLTLALKVQTVYAEMNRRLSEQIKKNNQASKDNQETIEGIKKENQSLSEKIKEIEEDKQTLLKVVKIKQLEVTQQIALICDSFLDHSEQSAECEKIVKLIQDFHLDVNTFFKWCAIENATFLMLASWHDSPKIILKLLELGADPRHKDDKGYNCLHNMIFVVTKDLFSIIDNILKRFPDLINVGIEGNKYTLLHIAAKHGWYGFRNDSQNLELLEKLLKAGANIHAVDNEEKTPVDHFFNEGKAEFIKLLMVPELKIDKCKDQGEFIVKCIRGKQLFKDSALMDKLLEMKGWGLQAQQYLLHFACDYPHEELLQKILEKWAVADTSENCFINEKAIVSKEKWSEWYPIQTLINTIDQIDQRATQKRMIVSLLKYMDLSKLKKYLLYVRLIRLGYHEALKIGRFDRSICRKKWSAGGPKRCERYLLEKIKQGVDKQDYIETFKLFYEPGGPIDPDLQSVYDENFST